MMNRSVQKPLKKFVPLLKLSALFKAMNASVAIHSANTENSKRASAPVPVTATRPKTAAVVRLWLVEQGVPGEANRRTAAQKGASRLSK